MLLGATTPADRLQVVHRRLHGVFPEPCGPWSQCTKPQRAAQQVADAGGGARHEEAHPIGHGLAQDGWWRWLGTGEREEWTAHAGGVNSGRSTQEGWEWTDGW